jgi:hypothetical protein
MADQESVYRFKSHDWLLLIVTGMAFVYGLLAFFFGPQDPKTVEAVVALFVLVVSNIVTYKATAHQYSQTVLPTSEVTAPVTTAEQPKDISQGGKVQHGD